ncbi:MAG: sugar phosphate isomerase/epimerase family protein [Planctomycetota bacterium]
MQHRIGAQTIVWGENIKGNMDYILSFLSGQGYAGVETGMRHFDPNQKERYRELYTQYGITPLGIHSGGTFWDPQQAAEEMKKIGETIHFASALGFRYLVISGNPEETVSSMKESAKTYTEIGKRCLDAGVRMAYHNHNWEFEHDGAIIDVVMNETSEEEVSVVLDTAWASIAGMELSQVLDRYGSRIAYLHIKDAEGKTFCELGTGGLDLPHILSLADGHRIEWLVVEQDYTSLTPEESMRLNMRYLREKGDIEL